MYRRMGCELCSVGCTYYTCMMNLARRYVAMTLIARMTHLLRYEPPMSYTDRLLAVWTLDLYRFV